ncbi:MerR family transcriptional regulator [Nitrobacter sp. TKz-YC02]|uniref:MerR family transcriptional regulator n=1 Tax=Nitrobacter sp. TKz-YC02 TaxID=3398704 RepID=UPI003CE89F42
MIGSREVQALTGLSADQLREWTGRRGLIRPDRPAQGKGTQARFSWQTVLVLRLALVMKQDFHIELHPHRESFSELQKLFHGKAFPGLWDRVVLLRERAQLAIAKPSEMTFPADETVIVMPLAPHLRALMTGFGVPMPTQQMPLFRAIGFR